MPITQDRMIALIGVARNFISIINETRGLVQDALARKRAGGDIQNEIEVLWTLVQDLQPAYEDIQILAMEEGHFRSMAQHNDRARQYMAQQREKFAGSAQRHPRAESVRHRVKDIQRELQPDEISAGEERLRRWMEKHANDEPNPLEGSDDPDAMSLKEHLDKGLPPV